MRPYFIGELPPPCFASLFKIRSYSVASLVWPGAHCVGQNPAKVLGLSAVGDPFVVVSVMV